MQILETERLILRTWKNSDAKSYFLINQDPRVIEFLGSALTIDDAHHFINAANFCHNKY